MIRENLRVAARSLWLHRVRSALTVLSVTSGCFAIVFMSSLAQSAFETLRRGVEELGGARIVLIVPKEPERASEVRARSYPRGLTERDHDLLAARLPHVRDHSLYASLGKKSVRSDSGKELQADLIAADERFLDAFHMAVQWGRPLKRADDDQHARACVVGRPVADALLGGPRLGRRLSIEGLRCQVVGVLESGGRFGVSFGFDWGKLVVMPRNTVLDETPQAKYGSLILLKTDDPRSNEAVKRVANVLLDHRHHDIDDFMFVDFADLLDQFYLAFGVMEAVVGGLSGFALVIGGIGIMNMMLVSVSERVVEIGVRKALGARPAHIRGQFLTEAALLAAVGGIIGIAAGAASATLTSALIARALDRWLGSISGIAVALAALTALSVGVIFGWLPARRASALSPVEAMRR